MFSLKVVYFREDCGTIRHYYVVIVNSSSLFNNASRYNTSEFLHDWPNRFCYTSLWCVEV